MVSTRSRSSSETSSKLEGSGVNSCLFFCLVGGLFGGCEVLLTVAVVGLLLGLFGGRVCLHFCSQCFTHFHRQSFHFDTFSHLRHF